MTHIDYKTLFLLLNLILFYFYRTSLTIRTIILGLLSSFIGILLSYA